MPSAPSRSRMSLACVLGLAGALAVPAARAGEARITFSVPAGPAAAAIPAFTSQASVPVLANGDDLAGRNARELQGTYTLRQALDILLAGSGLTARFNANGSILIEAARPVAVAARTQRQEPLRSEEVPKVIVAGVRGSQRSSIDLKRNAATARDTIVAEDVGAFPDRNVAEAISRLAGVTLERGEYGEGTTINIRGNAANVTRVEIDGLGVQAGGGTDLNNNGSGRGIELRELSADLIKSIDVVKGATADMTEGSIGGAVIIRTRTGLDFAKRYISLRVAGQTNSINERWTPNLNLVFADRAMNGRLGFVVNLTHSAARNENHTINVSQSANGMQRAIDFDGSPEKTFAYNPATVSTTDPASTAPLARWAMVGGGSFNSLSPLEVVTRSAQAASKADCQAAFPLYSSADVAAIASAAQRAAAQNQRANELASCLNQWNDYTPQNLRYQIRRQFDRRLNGGLRVNFKVDDRLTLYAKADRSARRITDEQLFLSLGNIRINRAGVYADSGDAPAVIRSPLAGSGYHFYATPANRGTSGDAWLGMTDGSVVNVVPSSVAVDANHHVTRYTLADATLNNDQIYDRIATRSAYTQVGGSWRPGNLRADFLLGRASAAATRMQWRTNFQFDYGPATASISPDGIWSYSSAVSYDQRDSARYGALSPQAQGLPLVSATTPLTFANPRLMQRSEDTGRLDLAYATGHAVPFLDRLKFGLNHRRYRVSSWTGSGYTVRQAGDGTTAVVVPRVAQASRLFACEDTSASLGPGGTPCVYGITPSASPVTAFASTIVTTQAAFRDIVAQSLGKDTIAYFNSLPDRPAGLPAGWTEIDVRKVIALAGVHHFDLDCVRFCRGSDGNLYEQPRTGVDERTLAGYLSADFSAGGLPFGSELEGNFGWRVVRTKVVATGLMTFEDAAGRALSRNTAVRDSITDVMPILNLAWWPVRDRIVLRFSKAKAIARPAIEYLYSSGVTCGVEQPAASDGAPTMTCDGPLGNPALRPTTNRNYDLSLEWYPNRDTVLSVGGFRQKGLVGAPIRVAVANATPFADSDATGPNAGSLANARVAYTTYINGPAFARDGFEVTAKSAFTFLPSLLRHTGLDMNYTRARSRDRQGTVRELVTGDVLAPANELAYTWNASLWYDDGRWQARVALQSAASYFRGLTTLPNSYPANGVVAAPALPFNPPTPTFRDSRRFVDARVSYRFRNGLELFVEGRNLGRAAVTNSQGAYAPFAGSIPNILDYSYSGAQFMAGFTLRH